MERFSTFKGAVGRSGYNSRDNNDLLYGIRNCFMRLPISSAIRLLLLSVLLLVVLVALSIQPSTVYSQAQPTASSVVVEAIQLAKVRSGPGVDYDELGQIVSGATYPLIGRNSHFPWYLIQLPTTQGWVYADLVKVTGNLNSIPYTDAIITPPAAQISTATTVSPDVSTANVANGPGPTPTLASQTASQPSATVTTGSSVTVEAISQTRVRYGPGTDFPVVGTIIKGQKYAVLRRHALYPWLEIEYDAIPSKRAWVSQETVTIAGNLYSLPTTSDHEFGYPTLTATPLMVVTSQSPWTSTPPSSTSDGLTQLGNTIYNLLQKGNFEPGTGRQGSVFITDLNSHQSVSLNPGVAYSGVSMMKIPVLLAYYRKATAPPDRTMATVISDMMVCSQNDKSNIVLKYLGGGDELEGAKYVTSTEQTLGLKDTFLTRPFFIGKLEGSPTPTPIVDSAYKTDADQVSAEPDLYNQTTPADLGWLLAGVYQCALDGNGPIGTIFNGDVTMMECRHIINAMRADKIGTLIEAGVPAGIAVAHKHGWSDDTHGDAGLLVTPGGDYVLVAILHNQVWLSSDDSFPLVAEMSRLSYNLFNPSMPLDKIHLEPVPADCTFSDQLLTDLESPDLPPIR